MAHPRVQMLTWPLYVFLCLMCVDELLAEPHYMVAIPAVLEAGAETKFCASLVEPDEPLVMTVTLRSPKKNRTLLERTSSTEFHECFQFQAPPVKNEKVEVFEVEVRGNAFYSKEVRNVMIKHHQEVTFVQTDKPIYLPGQTVHFRVVTLDTKLRPARQMYDIIELADPFNNRIGQWLKKTSNSRILELSYSLNSEAREGSYQIVVSVGEVKFYHHFNVEKYVLPKFDVKIKVTEEVSIAQEEFDAEVCAKYTYGQPVSGSVTVEVCRPRQRYLFGSDQSTGATDPCDTKTKQADKSGCATFGFKISTFNRNDNKILSDVLDVSATVEEDGTGVSHSQGKRIDISYVRGKLSFIDTDKLYEKGSNVQGKVKAVYYDDTPIPDMSLYLFDGERWLARRLQNLTTDSNGVASFSFSTDAYDGDILLHVASTPNMGYSEQRTAFYEAGAHTVSVSQPPSPDTKTVSSLKVESKNKPLLCDTEEDVSIHYTIVKEAKGSVDVMYLVLSRGAIAMQGRKTVQAQDNLVNEGEVSFKLKVSPDMAPVVQVVAYAVLPSKNVIAHSADFSTEKCFKNKVSLEFSSPSAVPGEEAKMQLTAPPDSLCGVSAIDQSVLIKEPGKTLDAEKIFSLLPVRAVSYTPYQVEDPGDCLTVRPRRYVLPYPGDQAKDAHSVFKNVGLKMATNLITREPECLRLKGRDYYRGINRMYDVPMYSVSMSGGSASPDGAPPIKTVRTFFPETWIWDLVEVG